MKRIYTLILALAALLLSSAGASAQKIYRNQLPQTSKASAPQRAYQRTEDLNADKGVLMYGATVKDPLGPLHYVSFYSKSGWNLTDISEVDPSDDGMHVRRLMCGDYCGDKYYGYKVDVVGYYVRWTQWVNVDFATGKVTQICPSADSSYTFNLYDMAYDYSRNTCWALGYNPDNSEISNVYKVNLADGTFTKVASLDYYAWTMAVDYDGNAYVIEANSDLSGCYLAKLDPNDGFKTLSHKELTYEGQPVVPNYVHSMAFDHNSNTLYWLSGNSYEYQRVFAIDTKTATLTRQSELLNTMVSGLYIPFKGADSREAASKVTDLKASAPDDGTLNATLSWTNPTVNWRGDQLTEFKEVTVSRGTLDNVVATVEGTAGQKCTWRDENVARGVQTYYLTPYRKAGEHGLVDSVKVYVGSDVPGNVNNLYATYDGSGVKVTWGSPLTSHTGKGYDKASLKFDVIRMPGKQAVATDLTDSTYTDTDPGFFNNYRYIVVAKNSAGTGDSTTTNSILAGKPYEPAFYQKFSTADDVTAWQTIDNNNDGKTFSFAGGQFDEFENFCIYLSGYFALDDYLVSPPIHLANGKLYRVSILSQLGSTKETHQFSFTLGKEPTAAAQKTTIATHSDVVASVNGERREFSDVFRSPAEGNYYISVHCTSPQSNYMSYFGVRDFKVEQVLENDLAAVGVVQPNSIVRGKEATMTVKVKNAGSNPQSKYSVSIIDLNGTVLGSADVNTQIDPEATADVQVPFTAKRVGQQELQAKVTLQGDENVANDTTATFVAEVKDQGLDWNVTCTKESDLSQSTTEPISFMSGYSTVQTVYLNSEISTQNDGQIKGIAFQYTPNDLSAATGEFNVKVYMGTTDSQDLYTTAAGSWVDNTSLTLVYDGTQRINTGDKQLMELQFQTPFEYDHTKNLLVQVWKDGSTGNMFPALFDVYGGENWSKLRMLRYSGAGIFDFTQASYPVAGKPVAYFAVDFATGIENIHDSKGAAYAANGSLVLNGEAASVSIFNLNGSKLMAMSNVSGTVNPPLPRGLYLVRITDAQGHTSVVKLILGK